MFRSPQARRFNPFSKKPNPSIIKGNLHTHLGRPKFTTNTQFHQNLQTKHQRAQFYQRTNFQRTKFINKPANIFFRSSHNNITNP